MGEVIDLSAAKVRKSTATYIDANKKQSVTSSLILKLKAIGTGTKRTINRYVRLLLAYSVNAMASILSIFRSPIRSLCRLGTIAMLATLIIEGMNHWKDPLLIVWSIVGLLFFLGSTTLYDGIIEALYKLRDTIKDAH